MYMFKVCNMMFWYINVYHSEMITTIKLINIFISSHGYHCVCVYWNLSNCPVFDTT